MNYRDLYNQMKTSLVNAGATIEYEDVGMAMTTGMREYYREEEGFSIPDDLFTLFESFDGLEMRWSLETQDGKLEGFFQFESIEMMLENQTKNKLYADWYESDDISEIKKHRIFETCNGTDFYVTVVFDQGNEYQLYAVPEGSVNLGGSKMLAKIPLTIALYVQLVFNYYGVYSVRYHLHQPEFYQNPQPFLPEYALLKKHFTA